MIVIGELGGLVLEVTAIGRPLMGSHLVWQMFCGPVFSAVDFLGALFVDFLWSF